MGTDGQNPIDPHVRAAAEAARGRYRVRATAGVLQSATPIRKPCPHCGVVAGHLRDCGSQRKLACSQVGCRLAGQVKLTSEFAPVCNACGHRLSDAAENSTAMDTPDIQDSGTIPVLP